MGSPEDAFSEIFKLVGAIKRELNNSIFEQEVAIPTLLRSQRFATSLITLHLCRPPTQVIFIQKCMEI